MIQYRTLIKSLFGIPVSVKDLGAVGNGTADDTAAIQAAIDRVESLGGGTVYFPKGTYKITDTLTIDSAGVYLNGEGWKSIITRSTDFGDTLLVTGNDTTGTVLSDTGISNLTFKSTGATTSGAHIHLNGVDHLYMDNIYIQQGFIGIQGDALTAAYLSNIYLVFTNLYGGSGTGRRYMQFGSAAATYSHPSSGDVFITDFNLRGNIANQVTEYGICINSADGIWFENGHIGNTTGANIYFNRTGSDILNLAYFSNVMSDASAGYGVYFDGSTAYSDIKLSNFTIKGGGLSTIGVSCSSTCAATYIEFNNGSISEFKYEGVKIPDSASSFRMIEFNNVQIHGNATDTGVSSSGYYLGDAATDITINGGCSGRSGTTGAAGLQQYGIKFGTVTPLSNVRIIGVDLTGNATSAVNSVPSGVVFIDGYLTANETITTVRRVLGGTSGINDSSGSKRAMQLLGDTTSYGQMVARFGDDTSPSLLSLSKSRNATPGTHTVVNAGDELGRISFEGSNGTTFESAAQIRVLSGGTPGSGDMPGTFLINVTTDGSATPTERMRINNLGFMSITGSMGLGAPVTKTGDFSVATTENFLINNKSGSTCSVILPSSASFTGRNLVIKTIQAQAVVSASANVVPIDSAVAGTAILPATAGRWARLVNDGTNWVIMEQG